MGRARTVLGIAAIAAAAGAAAWALRDVPAALGGRPGRGERGERVRRSPQFRDGAFHNNVVTTTMQPATAGQMLRNLLLGGEQRRPVGRVPLVTSNDAATAPIAEGLAITWYGHATALVEIAGRRVLIDPVWSARCSPSRLLGPRRLHDMPVALADLPPVDAVIISHDHYDHLDMATIRALTRDGEAVFIVPLGVGAHLERWGVPAGRLVELDWNEQATVGDVTLTLTAARHFSGRGLARDNTLWGSWVIAGGGRSVFYTGDSGYFDGYAAIGAEHGPFDATLMQIGAYGQEWPFIHMTPEEAVAAHNDLGGGLLIPVHWASFNLAFHAWTEPADRIWVEAKARDVRLAVPRPGERVDVDAPPAVDGWWQALT
ncbi:MBL fold metallo-hydrolase [Luedemannella helvata]|uniref:MBL fold metallo-hydrolase n=1 Tax=Luedemannella helvata TaxID=349315 RepID=A0ABP4XDU7_9ACTN